MGAIELPKKATTHQPKKASHDDITGIPDLSNIGRHEMAAGILAQETDRLVQHLAASLPREALAAAGIHGDLKKKLYNCLEEIFHKVFSRYLETSDGKILLDAIERDGKKDVSLHTPRGVAELLSSGDGLQRFNLGEIEHSLIAGEGTAGDMEALANSILRQKEDVLSTGENVCTVVACAFRDNALKPKTVTDVKLCVNIADSSLIDPFFRYYTVIRYMIKDLISPHVIEAIDREMEALYHQEDPDAAAYAVACAMANDAELATAFVDRVVERGSKIDSAAFDMINIRQSIRKNADIENVCAQGFGKAVNALSATLVDSKLHYQFLEYVQNGYKVTIREYEDTDDANLPDERYQITVRFLDEGHLVEDCKAYDAQLKGLEKDAQHLWNLIEVIYQDSKSVFKVNDFEDLARKNKNRIKHLLKDTNSDLQYDIARDWDDISIVRHGKEPIRTRLTRMRERLTNLSECLSPIERRVMEERLSRLEKEYVRFDHLINPYLLQSGLVVDVDITSVKRKKTTLDSVALALEEFLDTVSRGFQLAAIDTFAKETATLPGKGSRRK